MKKGLTLNCVFGVEKTAAPSKNVDYCFDEPYKMTDIFTGFANVSKSVRKLLKMQSILDTPIYYY